MEANIIYKSDNITGYFFLHSNIVEFEWNDRKKNFVNTSVKETNLSNIKQLIRYYKDDYFVFNFSKIQNDVATSDIRKTLFELTDFPHPLSASFVAGKNLIGTLKDEFDKMENYNQNSAKHNIAFESNLGQAHLSFDQVSNA